MLYSSLISLIAFVLALISYFAFSLNINATSNIFLLWVFVILLLIGSVCSNLRNITLSTVVSILFDEDKRSKANGLIGVISGLSFAVTSVANGLVIGYFGMEAILYISIILTIVTIFHLRLIEFNEDIPIKKTENKNNIAIESSTFKQVLAVPGLLGLILFTTINNFLGGVFMALIDAYGLSLVSVQTWGFLWGFLSTGFIFGGLLVAKFGISKKPLRLLILANLGIWITCILFTIQKSVFLTTIGIFIWMTLIPYIEAIEHTIVQKVTPIENQGKIFGFAQSVESAASPITTFFVGPLAQFIFIPFMTDGHGVKLIGSWFGTGADRGIALVFVISGIFGVIVTMFAATSKSHKIIELNYENE